MTDWYSAAELAFRNLVKSELTSYFPSATADDQVTKSDDTVYDLGFDAFLTTYPGAFPTEQVGTREVQVSWEILVDLLYRYTTNEAAMWNAFIAYRSDVFNLINLTDKGRNLNRTDRVRNCSLTAEDRPRFIPDDNDPNTVNFIAQTCVLTVNMVINKS